MYARVLCTLFVTCLSASVAAEVLISSRCWARATVPGATSAVVYCSLTNNSDDALSVEKVTSPVAGMVIIHETVLRDDMTMMLPVETLLIVSGEEIELQPGGRHMMLTGLKKALAENEIFQITVLLSDGRTINANEKVGSIAQVTAP